MADVVEISNRGPAQRRGREVFFDRAELQALLDLYSRRVMSGEWRDYAIDHDHRSASFSIFRHAAERPLFSITKSRSRKGPDYALLEGPRKIKQSRSLREVLAVLDRKPRLIWESH